MRHDALFVLSRHNSLRSQIAEGLARHLAPSGIEIYSAGPEPTALHPCVVRVMSQGGIGVSRQSAKALSDVRVERISTVITLCCDNVSLATATSAGKPRARSPHGARVLTKRASA